MNIGALLNLVGLSMGVLLYAMLLFMVLRVNRPAGGPSKIDPLLLLTSVLGLTWNLCALPAYALPRMGIEGPFPYVSAIGFAALGFLPAVVVQSVIRGEHHGVRGVLKYSLAAVAYGVSAVAAIWQLHAAASGETVPASLAMRLLTYTYVALVIPLAVATRRQPGSRRALWAASLAVFAVSALHLSQLHPGEASWPVELVGHHASLPLAFAILYQDFPFALADLFLKRALALLAIVGVAFAAIATFGVHSAAFAQFVQIDPRQISILVTLWVATALLYPRIERVTAWFVDAIVLHRPDYRSLRAAVSRSIQARSDVAAVLVETCRLLAPALSSPSVIWKEWHMSDDEPTLGPIVAAGQEAAALLSPLSGQRGTDRHPTAAAVIIPTAEAPPYLIAIAQPTGGRRFLSDDLALLEAIALIVARRIDAIRITNERYEREIREREIGKLATEAELRALRAQINPHFLFNALTTIGHLIQTAPPRALQTLLRLTSLLRAVLKSEGEFTTLGRELAIIESYLDIERARFEQRLTVIIDVPQRLRAIQLPPFVLQPLVENAVKHGIAHSLRGGEVTVCARVEEGISGRQLVVAVRDTGAGTTTEALNRGRRAGVGLSNIERRLDGQYGSTASLSIRTSPGEGTVAEVRIPVQRKPAERSGPHQVAM